MPTPSIAESYPLAQSQAKKYLQLLSENWPHFDRLTPEMTEQLTTLFMASKFAAETICKQPQWLDELLLSGTLLQASQPNQYGQQLNSQLISMSSEAILNKKLRDVRNREIITILWQELLQIISVEESLVLLSELAEALIIFARDAHSKLMEPRFGLPRCPNGLVQPMLILGMGKLGGKELNYSSDIDLIFTFNHHGETQGGSRSIENQQYFIKLGQKIITSLNNVDMNGFCYRVDMRLRPFGDSGPLVMSFTAMEDYYQQHGRDWERFAMVKARVLGPKHQYVEELEQIKRPFSFRRYIDFSAIESLRKMKAAISAEYRRRQLHNNIKLGQGGIREIEFIVQSFQLIRGGRQPNLQSQSLLHNLTVLVEEQIISPLEAYTLRNHYLFLRKVENNLQAMHDKQTQTLPDEFDELDWQSLCYATNATSKSALLAQINQVMAEVHQHFTKAFGEEQNNSEGEHCGHEIWQVNKEPELIELLEKHQIDASVAAHLIKWHRTVDAKRIGERGQVTLDKLMPELIHDFTQSAAGFSAFDDVTTLLSSVLTRTTYLELLLENPPARKQLIKLCESSPFFGELICKFPILLDDLIDPTLLHQPTPLEDYSVELRQYMLRIPDDDLEQQMEALRQFKLSQQLKIAAADISGVLPIMQVSDHLTFLAEAIIEQVVNIAWQQMTQRFGKPTGLAPGEMGFAVIGYGKSGGYELSYSSDLDLVFLHSEIPGHTEGGAKSLDCHEFYLKLAQRILHLFSTNTLSGILYDVDMRLRPSGASGLLVSNIERFGEYQRNDAWTWEHQALVRARPILASPSLVQQFVKIRQDVLCSERDPEQLKSDVQQMRSKMREHLEQRSGEEFDIKQSHGGITDIEFICQYLVLKHAKDEPNLTIWSDNVRIFESLAMEGVIDTMMAEHLIDAYCALRNESHRRALHPQKEKRLSPELQQYTQQVIAIWEHCFR